MSLRPAYGGDGYAGAANFTELSTVYIRGDAMAAGGLRLVPDETGTEPTIGAEYYTGTEWVPVPFGSDISTAEWVIDDDLGEIVLDEFGEIMMANEA